MYSTAGSEERMGISQKGSRISHGALPVEDIGRLVSQWRAELSETKDQGVRLDTTRLGAFFESGTQSGLPVTLAVYAMLACEWLFRIRPPTKTDIDDEIEETIAALSNGGRGLQDRWRWTNIINSIKPQLQKQLRGYRIFIPVGFSSAQHKTPSLLFSDGREHAGNAARPLIPPRRGRIPLLGPIMAGIAIMALGKQRGEGMARSLGQELCTILMNRKLLPHEFPGWTAKLETTPTSGHPSPTVPMRLAGVLRTGHRRAFGSGISLSVFIEQCFTHPRQWFGEMTQDWDILGPVAETEWSLKKPK
jgi:hypothetical protein